MAPHQKKAAPLSGPSPNAFLLGEVERLPSIADSGAYPMLITHSNVAAVISDSTTIPVTTQETQIFPNNDDDMAALDNNFTISGAQSPRIRLINKTSLIYQLSDISIFPYY